MKEFTNIFVAPYTRAFRAITPTYPNFLRDFIIISIFLVLISAFASIVPLILKKAANLLTEPTSQPILIYIYVAGFAIAWTTSKSLEWIKTIATGYVRAKCDSAFYTTLFDSFLKIPIARKKEIPRGDIVSDFDRSKDSFGQINNTVFWILAPLAYELIFAFIILCKETNAIFSALFLISILALFGMAFKISQKTQGVHLKLFSAINHLTGFLIEKIDASHEIAINQSEKREIKSLRPIVDDYASAIYKANSRMAFLLTMQVLAIGLVLLAFSVASANLVLSKNLKVGDFIMIISYTIQLTSPLAIVASSLVSLKSDYLALGEGLKYIDMANPRKSEPVEHNHTAPIYEIKNYKNTNNKKINLTINRGDIIAITGPSGSGKTTLMHTMLGFRKNYIGNVKFCGYETKNLHPENILRSVSVVSQTPFIFSGTVRENLLYGTNEAISDDYLLSVLNDLRLEFDPQNSESTLDFLIGGENRALSGGEIQRIAIARAVIRNKETIVLDEPTSALDGPTELRVLKYLRSKATTLIFITHREAPRSIANKTLDFSNFPQI